jgi:hypothetical protein
MPIHVDDTEPANHDSPPHGITGVGGAYPIVRAALYFEGIKGFGDWRILISSRTNEMLRKVRKRDSKSFKIMMKKIR